MVLSQLLRFCVLATVTYAPITALPAAAQTPATPNPASGSRITNAGVARANGAVDSVFVEKRKQSDTVDIGDFTYADAAQILDIPVGTVMSRLHRGRRILKQELALTFGGPLERGLRRRFGRKSESGATSAPAVRAGDDQSAR